MAKEMEKTMLAFIQAKANGVTTDEIILNIGATKEQCKDALNALLQSGNIKLLEGRNKTLIYKFNERRAPGGSTNEEVIVFNIIRESGNKGVWIRDIRRQSNLSDNQLKKILQTLESKCDIKAVKSVTASKKKVYMLYDLEPDQSVTGGAWYQDQEFDSEYVDVHVKLCLDFLRRKREHAEKTRIDPLKARHASYATAKEVQEYLAKTGVSKVQLHENDIERILNVITYDGDAERTVLTNNKNAYFAVNKPIQAFGLMQSTCGVCPLIANCVTGSQVSPNSCQYMSEWLE